ncbi:MAG: hypothetical protein WDN08_09550 [Rhizomicrobium sp.]
MRERVAFVQDAFVRDVNARSVAPAADPKTVDKPALAARLLADARRVIGAAKIVNVQLLQIAISPIRPGEAMAARAPDEAPAAATPARPRMANTPSINSPAPATFLDCCLRAALLAYLPRP